MNNPKSTRKGFSLIEMIVYVVILSFLILVLINTLHSVMVTYRHVRVQRAIETSAFTALERVTKEIRNGISIDTSNSTFNSTNGKLTLSTKSPTEVTKTVALYLDQGVLKISENGTYTGQLTASSTTITDFTLVHITQEETEAIKITLTLQAGSGAYIKREDFYTTAVLRGTY
jgi:prepilin-type N-terminal cleavage/methylation domain-containing protein